MRIHLIDPGLRQRDAHHTDWDLRLTQYLVRELGHEVGVYGNQAMDADTGALFDGLAAVEARFDAHPYADPRALDPVCGELTQFCRFVDTLSARMSDLPAADLWLLPTLFDHQLAAIARAAPQNPVVGVIHFDWLVGKRALSASIWRYAANLCRENGVRFGLGVTVPELKSAFDTLLGVTTQPLPIPYAANPDRQPRERVRTVGFFGNHREEKGIELMRALISWMQKRGYQILLHDTSGRVQTADRVRQVEVIRYVDELSTVIDRCDLVVVPYRAEPYSRRMSGIVVEAVARGVPVVAPSGSASGRLVAELRAGELFDAFDAGAIVQAVERIEQRYPEAAREAAHAARKIAAEHGMPRFADALLQIGESATK